MATEIRELAAGASQSDNITNSPLSCKCERVSK
jgi:hypothetical protein